MYLMQICYDLSDTYCFVIFPADIFRLEFLMPSDMLLLLLDEDVSLNCWISLSKFFIVGLCCLSISSTSFNFILYRVTLTEFNLLRTLFSQTCAILSDSSFKVRTFLSNLSLMYLISTSFSAFV